MDSAFAYGKHAMSSQASVSINQQIAKVWNATAEETQTGRPPKVTCSYQGSGQQFVGSNRDAFSRLLRCCKGSRCFKTTSLWLQHKTLLALRSTASILIQGSDSKTLLPHSNSLPLNGCGHHAKPCFSFYSTQQGCFHVRNPCPSVDTTTQVPFKLFLKPENTEHLGFPLSQSVCLC